MRDKRGIFFSTDALIALVIIFMGVLVIYPIVSYSNYNSQIPGDIIKVFSDLKIGDIENSYVENLISEGKITDLNKSVLEQIGEFYVTNITLARELSENLFSALNVSENIGVWYGEEIIFLKNTSSFEDARNIELESQMISGIKKGETIKGFVAKSWLKKINEKESTLFIKGDVMCGGWKNQAWGYYCDVRQANATYIIDIPENATIKQAYWLAEGSWTPQYSKLYINNNLVFAGNINYYQIVNITSYLVPGENTARIEGSIGADDGASHIVVDYKIPDMITYYPQEDFYFNKLESESVLHYEKSLFIPTEISEINISLNVSLNTTLSFKKRSESFQIGTKSPVNNRVVFSDAEIKSSLNSRGIPYSDLSNEYFYFVVDVGSPGQRLNTFIGGDSKIFIKYLMVDIPYGSIDLAGEIPVKNFSNHVAHTFYRNVSWEFYLPTNAIPLMADWQLGWFLTSETSQKAIANSVVIYSSPPEEFLESFSRIGYTPTLAEGLFEGGVNNLSLEFGNGYSVSTEASYGFLRYFVKSYVNYGGTKEKAKGGARLIEFEDGSLKNLYIGNQTDPWDPEIDAIDDAVERLIQQLDSNGNGKVDLLLDDESFDIDSIDISGVPSIWSTEIQVRRWS